MAENGFPALDQLEATPEILRALMTGIDAGDALWKPAPNRFSIAEVLEHLSHVEGHCFRSRVDRTVGEDCPLWEVYDPQTHFVAGQYSGRDPEDSFDHFEEQRDDNLKYLRNLPAGSATRVATHPELGPVTLTELLNEWAFHDLGHIRQISELIRARKYYPHMGAFQKYYSVNP